ncbi:MAG TPA: hypothetical protein VGH20_16200 [Myxococcales bacterium]|jgi:hypothetical protein
MKTIERRKRRGRVLLAATGLGLIAAGCGGGGEIPGVHGVIVNGVVGIPCDAGVADAGCPPGVVINPDGGVDGGTDGG